MTVGANVKSCYFSIKSAEATLQMLVQKSVNSESQQAYKNAQIVLEEVKSDLYKQIQFLSLEEPQYKN